MRDAGIAFAEYLSHLVEVCAQSPLGSAAREAAAREVEHHARHHALAVELDAEGLRVEGQEPLALDRVEVEPLVSALQFHQVGRLSVRQLTPARELLELGRLLSAPPLEDPRGGAVIEAAVTALRLWNVELVGVAALDAAPLVDALPPEYVAPLRDASDYAHVEGALARLATHAEAAMEAGDARTVGATLVLVDHFERHAREDGRRHAAEVTLRRLLGERALRMAATLVPAARRRGELLHVFRRLPEEGAAALFSALVEAQDMRDRRAYVDALVALHAGVPMLVRALDDVHWFVARNAAELLGEMRVDGVEPSLAAMLRSPEERRRVAAASALARLRTPSALAALNGAVNDESPRVRYFANSALIARIERATAPQLGAALEQEGDPEMKLQIISALGRLGTPDAVQKLIRSLTSPGSGGDPAELTSEFRSAAMEAVAAARGAAALYVIGQFRHDRDPRVRETVRRIFDRLRH